MKKFAILAAVVALIGCTQNDEGLDNITSTPEKSQTEFYASMPECDTRTYVEDNKYLRWNADDEITVFAGNSYNSHWQFAGEDGANSGKFNEINEGGFVTGSPLDLTANYAIYPYDENITITEAGVVSLTLPAVQEYNHTYANSFGAGANTMMAVTKNTSDNFLAFKNLCGYLKLKFYGDDVTVKSITVKGNNGEKIAGKATVSMAYGSEPTITMGDDATDTITIDCGEGVALSNDAVNPTTFWVVIPEITFEDGITIEVTDINNQTFSKQTTNAVPIENNLIQPMAALGVAYAPAGPANNEIWYTNGSTTEATTPNNTNGFGANIISNTYDSTKNCWVIKFDGDVTTIGYGAFESCNNLTSVTIPNSVTKIGPSAFRLCTSLESFTIPNGVKTIGSSAFYYCGRLASVTIPDSVTEIDSQAFYYCDRLKSVYCKAITPPTRESIFCYYDDYEESTCYDEMVPGGIIYVPSVSVNVYRNAEWWSLENIVGYDFMCDEIATDEHVPANNEIWYTATEKVDPYDADAFDFNIHIQSNEWDERTGKGVITFDGYVTTIGDYAFLDCTMLTSVTLPNYIKEIGASAFMGCSSLTFVTIPDGVTSIGHYAFNACSSLKLFSGNIASRDGRCLIINGELKAFAPAGLTQYAIPWGVTSIDYGTFHGCTNLTSVVIREDVTTIEDWAFYYCTSLTSVYCNATTPPSLGVHVFDHAASGNYEIIPCTIYVPAESEEAYKTSLYWKNYASNIVGR